MLKLAHVSLLLISWKQFQSEIRYLIDSFLFSQPELVCLTSPEWRGLSAVDYLRQNKKCVFLFLVLEMYMCWMDFNVETKRFFGSVIFVGGMRDFWCILSIELRISVHAQHFTCWAYQKTPFPFNVFNRIAKKNERVKVTN